MEHATLGPEPTLVLSAGGSRLEVALLGATPLRWFLDLPDGEFDVLDGYRDAAELRAQDGVRNGIMAPFCNRVREGRYTFDGVEHDLLPGSRDRTIYHGLTRRLPFTVLDVGTGPGRAEVSLRCTSLRDSPVDGYPFPVVVDVRLVLGHRRLEVEVTGTNQGSGAAPFAMGWHPYFRLPAASTVDELALAVPASQRVRTDPDLLPLPGAAALDAAPPEGIRWDPFGDAVVDAAFGGLREVAGSVRSVLTDPAGLQLSVEQHGGLVHVFTGDTLARDRRRSVAVEPVETLTDAFNRPDCADAVRLEADARRTFRCAVEVHVPRP